MLVQKVYVTHAKTVLI